MSRSSLQLREPVLIISWAPTDEDTAQEASAGDVEKAENGAEREEGLLASENKALLA